MLGVGMPRHRGNRRERVEFVHNKVSRSDKMIWECVCPMCGRIHEVEMFWTGRGVPHIFCDECKMSEWYEHDMEPYNILREVSYEQ